MKKLKARIEYLGLNFKKEMTIVSGIAVSGILLSLVIYLFLKSLEFAFIAIFLFSIFAVFYLNRYKTLEDKTKIDIQNEFISIFSFFKIYLKNGMNVYTALNEICKFVSPKLRDRFNDLLIDIDQDKSVTPFVKFARTFNELIIEQMMISVYQMIDEGSSSPYFAQFELIFTSLQKDMYEKELDQKESMLSTQCVTPLIGSGILVILITIGIVTVVGGMISGL